MYNLLAICWQVSEQFVLQTSLRQLVVTIMKHVHYLPLYNLCAIINIPVLTINGQQQSKSISQVLALDKPGNNRQYCYCFFYISSAKLAKPLCIRENVSLISTVLPDILIQTFWLDQISDNQNLSSYYIKSVQTVIQKQQQKTNTT